MSMFNPKPVFALFAFVLAACGGASMPVTPTRLPVSTDIPMPSAVITDTVRDTADGGVVITLAPGVTMELVRVPAGDFLMGSADGEKDAIANEKPQTTLSLSEYLIGKYDVTNVQYGVFTRATGKPWSMPAGKEQHPVVNLTWKDAIAFSDWLSQITHRQVQLPTEAQWEKAARGTDGRKYPWGNEEPDAKRLNFNNNVHDTTVVGLYSPQSDSPYGAVDMAGNVRNWTSSLLRAYPYRADDGRENQQADEWRSVRGGGFIVGSRGVRSASRESYSPTGKYDSIGIRVVMLPG
ncbi:MAG TPA: formylglycine-generating enzyme family protein [Anaerolineae bacterium]|jgi:serine/threonine-protein kinase